MVANTSVSLNSAEAELYELATGIAEGRATKHQLKQLEHEVTLVNHVGIYSSKARASKRGLGRMKHVILKYMFVQVNVEKKQTILASANMKSNMAELMTKCNKCETHVNGVAMLSLNLNGDDGKTRLNRTELMWDLDKCLGTSLASMENHARFQLRTSRC